ncbi:methyltransferase domain-containing protein [Mycolicibacterium sp. P9-64]|uniref:cyclopropane mycolic acid synthase family methyltransferase n=1 Tax=Mycolicibacterium sp. P9-64 TaxID=2024612 RepID=UPI0011ED5C0A|nr:cyclopropane mycolic acid synthase family methyltransferase [Mycolicibacterium sp. P9-64]KAA0087004.1 methyltransferase domain-containing protein [Mycolicibacterium sp. P9-64]
MVNDQIPTSSAAQPKWLSESTSRTRGSNAEQVQSHYDLSNEFFALWQDTNQVYSCAYFERDDMTLDEAQVAKIDLALGKLGLQPGMTLLDVGCGWGAAMMRAVEKYDVNVVGLTLSHNQKAHIEQAIADPHGPRHMEVRLASWEEFNDPVDRVVSIGAFEHFGFAKYQDFFQKMYKLMPDDGVMLLHTIVAPSAAEYRERELKITMSRLRFVKFILDEIFPGGRLPAVSQVEEQASDAGFRVTRVQPLRLHYARTLDTWAANLQAQQAEAISLTSREIYDRYMRYLTGCADLFHEGFTDVCQFTCEKT